MFYDSILIAKIAMKWNELPTAIDRNVELECMRKKNEQKLLSQLDPSQFSFLC